MFGLMPLNNQLKINENSTKKQMQYLATDTKPSQRKLTQRFQKITEDLDQSFSSRNQQNIKTNLNKSRIQRKDTQQTDPSQTKISSKNSIQSKNQQMTDLIQKSQNDPFIRRKLKALMENDLKSLKKLNDQTGKTFTTSSSKTSLFNDPEENVMQNYDALESQYTRIPKDIGKILKKNTPKQSNTSIKKVNSQPYLTKLVPRLLYKLTLPDNGQEIKMQKSFTTLRKEAYKKKIQNLEILKQVPKQNSKQVQNKNGKI